MILCDAESTSIACSVIYFARSACFARNMPPNSARGFCPHTALVFYAVRRFSCILIDENSFITLISSHFCGFSAAFSAQLVPKSPTRPSRELVQPALTGAAVQCHRHRRVDNVGNENHKSDLSESAESFIYNPLRRCCEPSRVYAVPVTVRVAPGSCGALVPVRSTATRAMRAGLRGVTHAAAWVLATTRIVVGTQSRKVI